VTADKGQHIGLTGCWAIGLTDERTRVRVRVSSHCPMLWCIDKSDDLWWWLQYPLHWLMNGICIRCYCSYC